VYASTHATSCERGVREYMSCFVALGYTLVEVLPKVVQERIVYLKVRKHRLLEILLKYHLSCELKVVICQEWM